MVAIHPISLPHDDASNNVNTEIPVDESKRHLDLGEPTDKIRLRTLGDGPCAPDAAAEAAEEEMEDQDLEISPGYKGWISLVGVSHFRSILS
jgi:hypothetical protein